MAEMKNVHKILNRKLKGKDYLEDLDLYGRIKVKRYMRVYPKVSGLAAWGARTANGTAVCH
jgi:hypothetical protein